MYNYINSIRKIAYTGLFIAISIILTRFFSGNINIAGIHGLRLSFGEIPIILNGLLLGPIFGAACGALSDIIGYAINPVGGAYFPGYTLTAVLTGLIPGLLAKYCCNGWKWSAVIIITLTEVIIVPLNTLWLSLLHGKAYITLLIPRIIGKGILIPAYVIIIKMTMKHLQHTFSFTKQ